MTAIVVTYLQIENNQAAFVNENNARIDVMARPNSYLCTYTSPSMPKYIVLSHTITAIM